jgi:ElaB/YqjD/DUF883 family membrane-anchored ribosome-binding protein
MEVYFKQLISEEDSLEKLVSDLERVVQGADDFAKAIGVDLGEHPRSELAQRLRRLKERCQRLKSQIAAKARATDRAVRRHPYSFVGAAVVLGFLVGIGLGGKR